MTELTDYAVFEFLNQGNQCYKIHSVRKGVSLMQYVKETESMTKKDFYHLTYGMAEQLEMFYKSAEKNSRPCHGYVNPLSFIVTENGEVQLLDVTSEESADLVKRMQKRDFRNLFVRKEQVLTQTMEQEDDLYGFGKCLQFVYLQGKFQNAFSRIEKWHIRRMIEKCLTEKDVPGCLAWIEKEAKRLQNGKEKTERKGTGKKKFKSLKKIVLAASIIGLLVGIGTREQKSVQACAGISVEKEWMKQRIHTAGLQRMQSKFVTMQVKEAKDVLAENIDSCLKAYQKLREQIKEKEKKAEELKELLEKYQIEIDEDGKIIEKTPDKDLDIITDTESVMTEAAEESEEMLLENP